MIDIDDEVIDRLRKAAEAKPGKKPARWKAMMRRLHDVFNIPPKPEPESHCAKTPQQPKKQKAPPAIPDCSIARAAQRFKVRTNAPQLPTQTLLEYLIEKNK